MKKIVLLTTMALLAAGCSAQSGADEQGTSNPTNPEQATDSVEADATSAALVASVGLTNGNTLEVYEGAPGDVFYSETGQRGVPRTDLQQFRGLTVRETLQALPLSTAIPKAVDALDTRRVEYLKSGAALNRAARPKVRNVNSAAPPGASESILKLSEAQFRSSFCSAHVVTAGDACTGYKVNCWPNSTNDYTYTRNDVNEGYAALDSIAGTSVTLRFRYRPGYSWSTQGEWTVPLGTWRWAYRVSTCPDETWLTCGCADWDYEARVSNAGGDVYNLSTQYSERDDGFWD